MITNKCVLMSNCCDVIVNFIPPCAGEAGIHYCNGCKNEIALDRTHTVVVTTHVRVGKGIYRPVNNM